MADTPDTFDLAILDAGGPEKPAIVFARYDADIALETLPDAGELKSLNDFRDLIYKTLLFNQPRPTSAELTKFGHSLFSFIVRGEVKQLYDFLPGGLLIRIHILTNRPDLKNLPWEYLQDPKHSPGPWLDRSIVRVLPSVGRKLPVPLKLTPGGPKIKILFVYADPKNAGQTGWTKVLKSVELAFAAQIPVDYYSLKVVEGTPKGLTNALQDDSYDIFHFVGHGVVDAQTKTGSLLLLNQVNHNSLLYGAAELATALRSRGTRLVILSACETSAGSATEPFNVVAEALLNENLPAVVANLLPVPVTSVASFVGRLYRVLLATGDIDRAVNEGRITLWSDLLMTQGARLEWGIPTLYRHIAGSQVFQPPVA